MKFVRNLLLVALVILVFQISTAPTPASALGGTKIELSFSNDRPLRGEILTVTGRLSVTTDGRPIPLVSVRLQYYRVGDTEATRDVSTVTSNPSGIFQDIVNTTYLLRIGPWVVNASFPSQLGYQSTSTTNEFTIVVQPTISLYLSTHQTSVGREVEFNGLLFACIPCINDQVIVTLNRPDNTSVILHVRINATGGPYPGGYYEGRFVPDMPGQWRVRADWSGNDVTLPTQSNVEELNVISPSNVGTVWLQFYGPLVIVVLAVVGLVVHLRQRLVHKRSV